MMKAEGSKRLSPQLKDQVAEWETLCPVEKIQHEMVGG